MTDRVIRKAPHMVQTVSVRSMMLDVIVALLPAFAADRFGPQNTGVNYGLLALGMSAGSLVFPPLARLLQGESAPHWIAAAAAAAGFVCLWFYGKSHAPKS